MRAGSTCGQILQPYRAYLVHLFGMSPDVEELLPPHISCRKRELYTGEYVAIGRNVTCGVARAARQSRQRVLVSRRRDRAKLVNISNQLLVPKYLSQRLISDSQVQYRPIAIHHRCDRWIERAFHS